jgi:3-hydroxyacyl-CoA dehydrogenase
MMTPECKALRHAFFASAPPARSPTCPKDTPQRKVAKVAVIGAGTMGGGISMNFLNAGIPVTILEMKQEALDRGVATIRKNYEAQVKKGKLKQDKLAQRMALLTHHAHLRRHPRRRPGDRGGVRGDGRQGRCSSKLDEVMKPGAILASNTSTLDVNRIASFTKRPQDVVGLHFFSPANVMKLLEVVRGEQTAKDVLATVMALAKKIRKTAVVSGVCDGFIGNRMIEQYSRQAGFLLEEGCTPSQVDRRSRSSASRWARSAWATWRATTSAGRSASAATWKSPHMRYSKTADLLCEMGRFGQKTGAGWYDYQPGKRDAIPSTVVGR